MLFDMDIKLLTMKNKNKKKTWHIKNPGTKVWLTPSYQPTIFRLLIISFLFFWIMSKFWTNPEPFSCLNAWEKSHVDITKLQTSQFPPFSSTGRLPAQPCLHLPLWKEVTKERNQHDNIAATPLQITNFLISQAC